MEGGIGGEGGREGGGSARRTTHTTQKGITHERGATRSNNLEASTKRDGMANMESPVARQTTKCTVLTKSAECPLGKATALRCVALRCVGLGWVGLGWVRLGWVGLGLIRWRWCGSMMLSCHVSASTRMYKIHGLDHGAVKSCDLVSPS